MGGKRRQRGQPRIKGPLEPLLECLPSPAITNLCEKIEVTRESVYRWQKNSRKISPLNKIKINTLCLTYGIEPIFQE